MAARKSACIVVAWLMHGMKCGFVGGEDGRDTRDTPSDLPGHAAAPAALMNSLRFIQPPARDSNWIVKNSCAIVMLSPFALLRAGSSLVILSEAKNPGISAQGKLREGSALRQINNQADSSSSRRIGSPQNDIAREFFPALLKDRGQQFRAHVLQHVGRAPDANLAGENRIFVL